MQYELFSDADFCQETPFTRRAVCMLGKFSLPGKTLQKKLQALGADIKSGLSRNLHFVVMGSDVSPEQTERLQQLNFHGFCPKVLTEDDVMRILQGQCADYMVQEVIVKQLHLTYAHFLANQMHLDAASNPLYTKELYLAADISPDLYQSLGNQGVYANAYIDDTTDALVISDATLRRMQAGESDDTLHYIEQQYNRSRAQSFRYVLVNEGALRSWLG